MWIITRGRNEASWCKHSAHLAATLSAAEEAVRRAADIRRQNTMNTLQLLPVIWHNLVPVTIETFDVFENEAEDLACSKSYENVSRWLATQMKQATHSLDSSRSP